MTRPPTGAHHFFGAGADVRDGTVLRIHRGETTGPVAATIVAFVYGTLA
ncbi:MAG: hypothetical protein ACRDKJ_01505 [Actinomycetota bacterium]